MKKNTQLKKFLLLAGIFFLVVGFTSCSDDDDEMVELAKGMIQVNDQQHLTGNILTVNSITVGQDSWLAAVPGGEENSNNFIAQPVMVEQGTTPNIQLYFDETAIRSPNGQKVVLKLYADSQKKGIRGEWDTFDEPIRLGNNELVMKTLTVYPDLTNFDWYEYYDSNEDGTLDIEEILHTYPSPLDYYNKSSISLSEFYGIIFFSANSNYNHDGLTENEWKEGYLRMYRNWAEDKFSVFDNNKNGFLEETEWREVFNDSGWFEAYDTNSNNRLEQQELNTGFFADWDINNDGKIDKEEFNNYRPFVTGFSFEGPVW